MCNGMVLAQVTQLSQQYFKELQSYAITEFDVSIVPIASTNEMVKFLVQQVSIFRSLILFLSFIAQNDLSYCLSDCVRYFNQHTIQALQHQHHKNS